jgi:ferric-dicitrate binding protein FerR (iron transport regulator)
MKHSYLADLLKRYLHHDTTKGETWTVDQRYEARDVPRPPGPHARRAGCAKARMWQQVQARTRPRPVRMNAPAVRWAAAALLVLALGATWLLPAGRRRLPATARGPATQPTTVTIRAANGWLTSTNRTGRPVTLALADGSTVALSSNSSLRYPPAFGGSERVVTLRGEAFFDVFHDAARPFRVLTDQVETTVLGTSFRVRAFPGQADAAVLVRTGRVRVRPRPDPRRPAGAGAPALVLLPNQQARYSAAARELRRALADQPALLHPRVQTRAFDERPVAEVLDALQAGYGVPIRYDGAALAACTVSLAFTTETLFEKLDLLCKALNTSYERTDEAVVFRSRGYSRN